MKLKANASKKRNVKAMTVRLILFANPIDSLGSHGPVLLKTSPRWL